MTTAATNAITVAQVFRRHGIHIGIGAPIMQLLDLAMAINLAGRHDVNITYERSEARQNGGHALVVGAKPRQDAWTAGTGIRALVDLPTRDSSEDERLASIAQLGEVAESMGQLLQEGTA